MTKHKCEKHRVLYSGDICPECKKELEDKGETLGRWF